MFRNSSDLIRKNSVLTNISYIPFLSTIKSIPTIIYGTTLLITGIFLRVQSRNTPQIRDAEFQINSGLGYLGRGVFEAVPISGNGLVFLFDLSWYDFNRSKDQMKPSECPLPPSLRQQSRATINAHGSYAAEDPANVTE